MPRKINKLTVHILNILYTLKQELKMKNIIRVEWLLILIFTVLLFGCKNKKNIDIVNDMKNQNIDIVNSVENQDIKTVEQITEIIFEDENYLQYDYAGGNGTILSEKNDEGKRWIFRKHEQISEVANEKSLIVYDQYGNTGEELFRLSMFEEVNISELAVGYKNNQTEYWLKISNAQGDQGWIYGGYGDPYRKGFGSVDEIFNIGNKIWTSRLIATEGLFAADGLNVRDRPGLVDTQVLFQLRKEDFGGGKFERIWGDYYYELFVSLLSLTSEKDTVNGVTEHWVKIKDKNSREGWVFGGFLLLSEGGGAKYYTPEAFVSLDIFPP
jgi:hypothetical protein